MVVDIARVLELNLVYDHYSEFSLGLLRVREQS